MFRNNSCQIIENYVCVDGGIFLLIKEVLLKIPDIKFMKYELLFIQKFAGRSESQIIAGRRESMSIMSNLTEYIGNQFSNPHGIIGFICCKCMNIINNKMYKKTISLLSLKKNQKLLDIGYGNGYLLKLVDKSFGCHLYGIDISEDMKNLAEKRNKRALKDNRLSLEVGDCCNLHFDDNTFDAISSINTVYFWTDTVKGLSEIHRCLVSDGCFINVVYTKKWLSRTRMAEKGFKKFEPEELIDFGKQAGFINIKIVEIVKGKSFAVVYKKD